MSNILGLFLIIVGGFVSLLSGLSCVALLFSVIFEDHGKALMALAMMKYTLYPLFLGALVFWLGKRMRQSYKSEKVSDLNKK